MVSNAVCLCLSVHSLSHSVTQSLTHPIVSVGVWNRITIYAGKVFENIKYILHQIKNSAISQFMIMIKFIVAKAY